MFCSNESTRGKENLNGHFCTLTVLHGLLGFMLFWVKTTANMVPYSSSQKLGRHSSTGSYFGICPGFCFPSLRHSWRMPNRLAVYHEEPAACSPRMQKLSMRPLQVRYAVLRVPTGVHIRKVFACLYRNCLPYCGTFIQRPLLRA